MMKKLLQRWLAMTLAVLMVMGTLPTTAWAARITDDEVSEQPVLDPKTDPVADTQGKHDDGDIPIDPVDPDGPPADLQAVAITNIQVSDSFTLGSKNVIATGAPATPGSTQEGLFAVALFPWFNTVNAEPYTANFTKSMNNQLWSGYVQDADLSTKMEEYYGPVFVAQSSAGLTGALTKIDLLADGTVQVNGADYGTRMSAHGTYGSPLNSTQLIQYAKDNPELYVPGIGKFDPNTQGYLPYKLIIAGTESYVVVDVNLPLTIQPLKVEIENPQAHKLSSFEATDEGKKYTTIRVTNQSGAAIDDVTVTVNRAHPTYSLPAGWGTTEVAADADGVDLTSETPYSSGYYLYLRYIYGLEGADTKPYNTFKIDSLAIGETKEIKLIIPYCNDPTDAEAVGAFDDGYWEMGGVGLTGDLFANYNVDGYNPDTCPSDLYSNYTVTAVSAAGDTAIPQNGGIHIAVDLAITPKVQFVDQDGNVIPHDDHGGNRLTFSTAGDGGGQVGAAANHTVQAGGLTLTWDSTEECYTSTTKTQLGNTVQVDGYNTGVGLIDGITQVPMYQVTVTDEPVGTAGTDTASLKGKGAYTWDSTISSRVDYKYYPKNAQVGVYARDPKKAFTNWTNASLNGPSNAGSGLSSVVGVNGNLTLNRANQRDVAVVANYNLVNLQIVTLYGGSDKTVTDNWTTADQNPYVYQLRISDGGSNIFTYGWDDGENDYAPSEGLTAQSINPIGNVGVPWSVSVPGSGTYTITINGQSVGTIKPSEVTPDGGVYAVYEIVGVTPKIVGATTAGTTMVLPNDQRHGRTLTGGNVSITGAANNSGGATVLYYPATADIGVSGVVADGINFVDLKYNGTELAAAQDASDWGTDADVNFNVSGTHDLVATFGAATGSAKVTVKKDTAAYTGRTVKLSTSATALTGTGVTVIDLTDTTPATGVYSHDAVTPGTYYVFVDGSPVNKSVTVTAGAEATATVEYFTLTLTNTDGLGYIGLSTSAMGTALTANGTTSGVFLSGTRVYIRADAKNTTNYSFDQWTTATGGTAPVSSTANSTSVASLAAETTINASFNKSSYQTQLKVTLDGSNATIGTDIQSVTCSNVAASAITGPVSGVWTATVTKQETWTVTTSNGTYTVTTNGDMEVVEDYAPAALDLYSVETVDTAYDTARATMTANGVSNLTRAIIKQNDAVTLSVTGATGYTHASPYWTQGTAGKGTVAQNSYTLTATLTETQTLTPTFTYTATINPMRGGNLVDVAKVEVKAGNTVVGTAAEQADHSWKVSGLTIGTNYDIWVNDYLSDKDTNGITAVEVPMWEVSVATSNATAGSASLTTAGNTMMPNGATNTTGWTITASANTGYRVADTAWALTAGSTYGTLAATNTASTTLTVPNAIAGDVTATAYFTQQWNVQSYVSTSGATSTATLTGGSGSGTSASHSTVTLDAGADVVVTFNRAVGEDLNGWTLASGSGQWSTDGTTWTTWATGAVPAATVTSFRFRPTANSTITAAVKTKTYPVQVIVRKDNTALTSGITVQLGGTSLTYDSTNKYWTGDFLPNTTTGYALTTNVIAGGGSGAQASTGKTMTFSVADGEGTGTAANLRLEVDYWTITLAAAANGKEDFATSAPSADATSRTRIVLDGGSVNIAANPDTNYKFNGWTSSNADTTKGTFAAAANAVTNYNTVKATATLTPSFVQKLGTVNVTVNLNGAQDNKSTDASAPADLHTVTLYQGSTAVGTAQTGKSGAYSFTNVPYNEGGTAYHVTVVKKDAASGAQTFTSADFTFSGNDGGTQSVTANYYALRVNTTQTIDSTSALAGRVAQSLSAITGTLTETDTSAIYVTGTTVNIKADKYDARYEFDGWTVSTNGTAPADATKNGASTTVQLGHETTLTAKFAKTQFNAYLDVTVNNVTHDNTTSIGVTKVELVRSKTDATSLGTPSYTGGHWTVGPLNSTTVTAGQWKITTVDGGEYYWPMVNTEAVTEAHLFGVTVENGAYGNATNKTYISAAGKTRAVAPIGENIAINANPDAGYTFSKWLAGDAASPTADLNATAEHVTAPGNGNFSFNTGYTTDDGKDLYLKPVYTFSTTIETRHLNATGTLTNVSSVKVYEAGTATTAINGVKQSANGTYLVSGLDPAKTYDIWVNDFKVGAGNRQVTSTNANGTVPVIVFQVTTTRDPAAGGTSNVGLNSAGSTNLAIVPNGAAVTTTAPTVNAAATVATGYRKRSATNDGTGNTFWTASAGTVTTPEGGTGNATTWTIASMTADVTLTAHYVRQYTASVSVSGTNLNANTKAEFTAAGSTGTAIASGNKSATVDANTYVRATFTPGIGDTLKSWTFTGGDLWTTDNKTAGTKLTTGQATSANVVYFFPTADNATLQADVVAAKYPVTVTVKLDNTGAHTGRTVELRKGSDVKYTLTESATTPGTYQVDALPDTYDVYVDGVTTGTVENTDKDISFTAADAEGKNGTTGADLPDGEKADALAKLTAVVNYYTINLAASPTAGGRVDFAASVGTTPVTSKIVLAGTNKKSVGQVAAVAIANTTDTVPKHYRFDNWTAGKGGFGTVTSDTATISTANGTYILPTETTLTADNTITKDAPITLTASFQEQYRVTVAKKSGLPDTATVGVKNTGADGAPLPSVLVDADGTSTATLSASVPSGYFFKEWAVTGGSGTFGAPAAGVATLSYTVGDTFIPAADSTITLDLWEDAALTSGWVYDIVTGISDKGHTNITWTPNSAEHAGTNPTTLVITGPDAATTQILDLKTADASKFTESGGVYTLLPNYLKTLALGTYTVTATYDLDTAAGHGNKHTDTKTSTFGIKATAATLTKVVVDPKEDGRTTLKAESNTGKVAEYVRHEPTSITATNKLSFTWYYADAVPTEGAVAAGFTVPGTWTKISGPTDFPATGVPEESATTAMKGKYVFALVTADVTGTGTVVSNAIPVDYDATVTVRVDNSAIATAPERFEVYLRPVAADGTADTNNTAQSSDKKATWNGTTHVYETTDSALTGGVTYQVWVNQVSGSTGNNAFLVNTGKTVSSGPVANQTATVDFYTLTLDPLTNTSVTHAKDNSTTPQDVGEAFANYPALSAVVKGTNRAVATTAAVLTGTEATVSAAAWTQDYALSWVRDAVDVAGKQASGAASYDTGALTAAATVTAKLSQNTYTITGNVQDITSGTKNASITGAVLTVNGHTFTPSATITNGGADGATVTFTVPRSNVTGGEVNAAYTLTATPADGTTMKGYTAPASTTAPATVNTSVDLEELTAGTTDLSGKFTIFIEATNLAMRLHDDDDPTQGHDITASGTGRRSVTHTETVTFANYSAITKQISLINTGNADLKVTPTLEKSTNGGTSWSTVTLDASHKDTNGVTIQNLPTAEFDHAEGATGTYTVVIPADLENSDDVQYRFTFDSKDGRTGQTGGGPTLIYILNIVVDPVHVATVNTSHDTVNNIYTVNQTTIREANGYDELITKEDGAPTWTNTTGDITYAWYVAAWDADIRMDPTVGVPYLNNASKTPLTALTTAQGVSADGLSYHPLDADLGKALYLVAKGQGNATWSAMTPDRTGEDPKPPVLVPYIGTVTVKQNDDPITTNGTADKDYTVWLWNGTGNLDTTDTAHAFQAKWDDTSKTFKTDEVLYATDPTSPLTSAPYVYQVWANTVKGDGTLQNTGKTIKVDSPSAEVVYHQVNINNTSVSQNTYGTAIAPDDNNGVFYATAPHTQPTAKVGTIDVDAGGWVQTGTTVTFTYDQWDKDYDLAWSGGLTATGDKPNSGDKTHTATYSSQLAAVDTTLTLNLYPVAANVTGTAGWVNWITMALTDNGKTYTFTTQNDSNILGIGTAVTQIKLDETATFQLPKANGYVTTANVPDAASSGVASWEYVYGGNRTDPTVTPTINVNVTGTASQDTYDINLTGAGQNLKVTETALPKDKTDSKTPISRTGSIPNSPDAAVVNNTLTQEIHLNYNYPTGQTVTMEVENTTDGLSIYRVARGTATINPANCISETNFTGGTMAAGDKETITLTIADNLEAGSYQYSTVFTFYSAETGDRHATVTYNLTVIVDPLPFTAVTTAADGSTNAKDYTVTPTGATAITTTTNTSGTDALTALDYGNGSNGDYAYKWVRTASSAANLTNADLAWTAAGGVTVTGATDCTGTGHDGPNYTPNTADQGQKLYLVIYALNGTNATGAAISAPIVTGYTGEVEIYENGGLVTTQPSPAYKVEFVPSDGGANITGTWDDTADGYIATLDPEVASYTVKVSRYQGDTTTVDLTGAVITNTNRTAQAYYFTVTAKDFADKPYQSVTGEDFTADPTDKQFTLTLGGNTLTSGTPVLKDQSVTAKAVGWDQDYKLTWQSANTTTNVSANATTADTTTVQNSTAASGTGYTQTITDTTFLGGRLDQNTYTVTGSIKGNTGSVDKVEMAFKATAPDARNFILTTKAEVGKIDANNQITNDSANGITGDQGDVITFTVVKGVYDITAFDGPNTTIQSVTVNDPEVDTDATRNKETLTPEVSANGRVFTVYVEDSALALGVTDGANMTAGNHAVSTGTATNLDTVETNYRFADNVQVHYFNATTGTFDLKLNNSGNTDLVLSAPTVHKLNPGTVSATAANLKGVALGTNLATGSGYTDTNLTISGLVAANTALAVGDTESNAGKVVLKQAAANKDDAIYVIAFASTYLDSSNGTHTGPTVYYVVDLTVKPLPIVGVDAVKNDTTGELSLEGQAGAAGGLDHVWVDHDGSNTTAAEAANAHAIVAGDVSFVWVTAPISKTKAQVEGALTLGATSMTSSDSDVTVTDHTGKTWTPTATEQGLNFYLVAYRTDADSNATDFAVSDALYANVTVELKTYRTGTSTLIPDTTVQITGVVDDDSDPANAAQSNDGTLTVTAGGQTILFGADMNDFLHGKTPGTADDPAQATYYFAGWGAAPTGGITVDADDRLSMTYAITQKATVIGYYDLLPRLSSDNSFGVGAEATPTPANRTFTYAPNDGSQQVIIVMTPLNGTKFKDDGSTAPRILSYLAFEKIAGAPATVTSQFGGAGDYVLRENWIRTNLQPNGGRNGEYRITFYDINKGATTDGSTPSGKYEGYDRSVMYRIVDGEKRVYAQVEDVDTVTTGIQGHGTVQVIGAADGGEDVESNAVSKNGEVTIIAKPHAGYKFNGWTLKTTNGGSFANNNPGLANTKFYPELDNALVEASFVAGDFTVADKKALVIYGNSDFETGSDTSVAATAPEAAGTTFTYAVVNTADLPGWLELDANTGEFSFKTGEKVDTNVQSSTTGSYTTVDNEVVLTVRITSNAGKTKDVTYTIDVEPGTLTVNHDAAEDTAEKRGDAYKAANIAAGVTVGDVTTYPIDVDEHGVPMYNETVLKQLFAYTNVTDQANTVIDATGHAGDAANNDSGAYEYGTWTVDPTRFQGTGAPSTYKFTFTYKPDSATEKWNYTAGETNMTLTIAKPPVGALFADIIGNFAEVENVLKPGSWTGGDDSDYSLVAKPEGYDGTSGKAPVEMDYTDNTFRKNETITYLDEEPQYTVKLKSVDAAIHGTTFTTDELVGFKLATGSAYPTFTGGRFASADGEKTFTLELAPVSGNVWVGEHHAKFTLTGYSTAELAQEGGTPNVTATYELTIEVLPKVITSVDVKVLDPETTPDSVTGTTEGGGTVDDKTTDGKGNVPITDVTVTWGPEDGPDDKHTNVKVDVEIDPNYKYAEDDPNTDPDDEDITEHTETTVKETLPDSTVTNRAIPDPTVTRDGTDGEHLIHIDQDIPYLMHADVNDGDATDATGPKVNDRDRKVSVTQGAKDLGSYTIDLDAFGADLYDVVWTVEQDSITADAEGGIGAVLGTLPTGFDLTAGGKRSVTLDLSAADTSKPGSNYTLTLVARGKANRDDAERSIQSTYVFQLTIRSASVPQPPEPECPCKVLYYVGSHGVTTDATIEDVSEKNRPSKVPGVTALDGYVFRGWSLTNPATLKEGEKLTLVDPKTVEAKGETMTFYAVIVERPFHEHYVIGYPNGNFGPADDITRGSVATIIARAILPDFVEGSNYGNPGNYTDVSGHWAESAIAYCSKFGVFKGYTDGTFRPDQPITRQEFATVIARLDGELTAQDIPFDDIDEAGAWALNGIYTSYEKGWVNGYTDGTFKPLNNIRRDEAVKIFNAYLNRGVDADGLSDLHEYVHSGTASNVTGNGTDEYMTWSDVPKDHWAYYEIVEAANDHEFTPDFDAPLGYTLPEHWEKCWIDARWRYSDNAAADVH